MTRQLLLAAVLLVLGACGTSRPAAVIVPTSLQVASGASVDLPVGIVRGDLLGDVVELSLEGEEGIDAPSVSTSADSALLTVHVDEALPSGSYAIRVVASDGAAVVTSDPVALEVAGPAPGSLAGEIRSLLIPTPGEIGLPTSGGASGPPVLASSVSMVPARRASPDAEARLVPGELIVRLDPAAASSSSAPDAVRVDGVAFARPSGAVRGDLEHWRALESVSGEATVALAAALQDRPGVASATPNWIFSAHQLPELYELQWHFPAIALHEAWTRETGDSRDVTVAVIDKIGRAHV